MTEEPFPKELLWQVDLAQLNKCLCELLENDKPLPVSAQFVSLPHAKNIRDVSFTFIGSILAIFTGSVFIIMALKETIHMGQQAGLLTGTMLFSIGLLGAFFSYAPPASESEPDKSLRHGLIFTSKGLLVSLDQKFCWIPRSHINNIKYVRPRKESSDDGLWFYFKDKTNWKLSKYNYDYRTGASPVDVLTWFEKGIMPPFEEVFLKKISFKAGGTPEKGIWTRLSGLERQTLNETEIDSLGMSVVELEDKERSPAVNAYNAGVKIVAVRKGSFADENFDPGDIIISLNQRGMKSINDLLSAFSEAGKHGTVPVTFTVRRFARQ